MALTGTTAIWAIEDTAQLRAGETILIEGGAGVSPVSRSNWRNTSVPPWSPPPAPPISTWCFYGGADSVVDYNADAGAVSPPPIARYDLADAAEAHRLSEAYVLCFFLNGALTDDVACRFRRARR